MKLKNIALALFFSGLLVSNTSLAQDVETEEPKKDANKSKTTLIFGYERESDEVTGAVGTADNESLNVFSATDPGTMLYGQIPGLMVLQNGGFGAYQSPTFYVRGRSSFGDNSPLILVDGFERPISNLSAAEIESVTVLKDAGSTAIYGQRGANGVILVKTKRGKYGQHDFNVSYQSGINTAFRLPKMLDAYGYATAVNEARTLNGEAPVYDYGRLQLYKSGTSEYYPNVDWMDETLRDFGTTNELNLSAQGGKGRVRYYVGLNYLADRGLLEVEDNQNQLKYDKFNFRSNLDVEITENTLMKLSVGGMMGQTNKPGSGRTWYGPTEALTQYTAHDIFTALYKVPSSAFPVRYANGVWGISSLYESAMENPVARANGMGYSTSHDRSLYADLAFTQKLDMYVKGLSLNAAVSYNYFSSYMDMRINNVAFQNRAAMYDEVNDMFYNETITNYGDNEVKDFETPFRNQWRHSNIMGSVNYDRNWTDHTLNAMVFFHQDGYTGYEQHDVKRRQNIGAHIHYGYKNKYFLDLTTSYAGTSVLPKENRFIFYPAASFAWLASEESFLKDVSFIDQLKFRVSAGIAGSDLREEMETEQYLHDYYYLPEDKVYNFGDNNANQTGIKEGRAPYPGITTEKSKMLNVGIDLAALKKLQFSVDGFFERREDILVESGGVNSDVLGVTHAPSNAGIVENMGVDASLMWNDKVGELKYNIGAQFTFARNKVIEMQETYRENDNIKQTGRPLGQTFGLETNGFFRDEDHIAQVGAEIENSFTQNLRPGDIIYVDQTDDNIVNSFDRVAIGYNTENPEMYFSLMLGAEYKGIGFNAMFQGVSRYTAYLNTKGVFLPLVEGYSISEFSNDRWTPENAETATLPRLTMDNNQNNHQYNDIWLEDASFVKLRSAEVYYNFPESILSILKMKRMQVYLRGMNLFSIDKIKVVDPEMIGAGHPTLRSYHIGVNIGF